MTQLYTKFFARKAGALGICYYHTACIHAKSESFDDVREALYSCGYCGYEEVTVLEVSVTTDRVLTSDEKLFNQTNGLITAPHLKRTEYVQRMV